MPSDHDGPSSLSHEDRLESICKKLIPYARRLAGANRADDAEDLLQESLRSAIKSKSREWLMTDTYENVLAYVRIAMKNKRRDLHRRRVLHETALFVVASVEESKDSEGCQDCAYDPEQKKFLLAAIEEAIPDDERRRQIFELEHLEGVTSGEEIGKRLGVNRSTIKRARDNGPSDGVILAKIRRILERDGHPYESFFF